MLPSILFYTLLALWLLPAVALIVVYCVDVGGDWGRRLLARWNAYRAQQRIRRAVDPRALVAIRRSVVASTTPVEQLQVAPVHTAGNAGGAARPYLVAGPAMQVPLVLEDNTGGLHAQQWTLSLN